METVQKYVYPIIGLSRSANHAACTRRSRKASGPNHQPRSNTALKNLDEVGYSRLLVKISLRDAAHNPFLCDGATRLEAVAKRVRVNVEEIAEPVAAEFAAKRKNRQKRQEAKGNGHRNASRPVAAKTNRV